MILIDANALVLLIIGLIDQNLILYSFRDKKVILKITVFLRKIRVIGS